mmetsp:Transcript_35048/g.100942  ORF Transcript_35048/g.100942 Transcript_35048/m.100942 type:complete len:203 (+) Transcript_35048:1673-2281(+)
MRAPDDIPQVHEDALGRLLALLHQQRHNKAETFLRVPFSNLAFDLLLRRLLLLGHLRDGLLLGHDGGNLRRGLRHSNGLRRRSTVLDATRRRGRRRPAGVELNELRRLDRLSHLLGLLHLPDGRVVVVLDLPERLRVAVLLQVVDPRLNMQVQPGLGMILPLPRLFVHVPTAAVRGRLIVLEARRRRPLRGPAPLPRRPSRL